MPAYVNSNDQCYLLLNNMMDAFAYCKMVYDKQGRPVNFIYVAVNNAFEKLMGLSKEQIVGKRESEIMLQTKDGKTELFEVYGRVADTRKAEKLESYSNLLGIWLSIKVYSPQKGHFIAQFEDITEQVTMRKKLEDYAEHLEALVKERTNKLREAERLTTIGQIAGMVGHDIRTPLQAINSNIYLLKNYISSISDLDVRRDMTESLADIENNVEYITEITADLQDYARPLKPAYIEVNLLDTVMSIFKTIIVPANIKQSISIDSNFKCRTDQTFLKRILSNLVINAIQAMPNGGELIIFASKSNSNVLITTEDTGIGIPEEVKPKLFSPMITTKSKGHGLGLAVVKRLVEALNGTITFESQQGKGTKFLLKLPC